MTIKHACNKNYNKKYLNNKAHKHHLNKELI